MALPTAGLFARYEAHLHTGLVSGDPVVQVTDQAGTRHMTSLTSARRPTWVSAVLNGHAVYRFDGVDDLTAVDFASQAPPAWSLSLVVRSEPVEATTRKWPAYAGTDTSQVMAFTEGVTSGEWGTFSRTTSPTTTVQQSTTGVLTTTWCVLTIVWNGAAVAFYRDGTLVNSAALAGTFGLTTLSLGALESDVSTALRGECMSGDIALAGFWNTALTTTERSELHSYVQDTYGIVVSDYSGGVTTTRKMRVGADAATGLRVGSTTSTRAYLGSSLVFDG